MDTSVPEEHHYLPKERLDLPKPHEALPAAHHENTHHSQPSHGGKPTEVKTLLSWEAPGRPFRPRDKSYYINILIFMLIIEVILFIFRQYLLMLVVVALVFVNYALTTVPPRNFRYKISNQGFMVEDHFYIWQELYDFYFKVREGKDVLILRTKAYFPGELVITLGDIHKEQIKSVLLPYIPFREYVEPSSMEKAGDWISRTFPLEKAQS